MDTMIVDFTDCNREIQETSCKAVHDMWRDDLIADGIPTWEKCMEVFENFKKNGGSVCVSLKDGEFAGIIAVHVEQNNAQLCYFFVRPECRGNGLGTSLLNQAITSLKNKMIFIACDDHLVDFYAKRGFRLYDTSARLTSGRRVNAMIYARGTKI